jgi:ABC-type glycerol-3-phosphate transport system permease component
MAARASLQTNQATATLQGRAAKHWRALVGELFWHFVLSVFGLALLVPLLWLVSTSFKEPSAIFVMPPQWIPNPVRWQNFPEALTAQPFGRFLLNTLTITFFATLGTVLTASLAAFAFARLRFPLRSFWFALVLSTLMLPSPASSP